MQSKIKKRKGKPDTETDVLATDVLATDVLVIGAGPGGCSAAFEYVKAGLKVIVADAGPPTTDEDGPPHSLDPRKYFYFPPFLTKGHLGFKIISSNRGIFGLPFPFGVALLNVGPGSPVYGAALKSPAGDSEFWSTIRQDWPETNWKKSSW